MTPQAWVGCLGCYNDGVLTGEWVEGSAATEFVPCERPGHEEWWVFDFEDYEGLLEEECSPAEAQRVAELIEAIPDWLPLPAVVAWCKHEGRELRDWSEIHVGFTDAYQGEHESDEGFAQQLAEDLGLIDPEARWPNDCIDWERAAQELFAGDYWSIAADSGHMYVFRNC